jgi:hypothetical protein
LFETRADRILVAGSLCKARCLDPIRLEDPALMRDGTGLSQYHIGCKQQRSAKYFKT